MAKKKESVSLETILMNCRNHMRGAGSIEKNRDAITGLVFLKFAGDKFEEQRKKIEENYKDRETLLNIMIENPDAYMQDSVYYIPEKARWSYLVNNASENDIAIKIDTAMKELEGVQKNNLKGTLPQGFYVGLNIESKKLKGLIDEINKIDNNLFHEEDLIGRVYEYFLQNFSASASKEDGEFYTPAPIVQLIAELIEPYKGVVYDPCCGSGGMFVQSRKFIEKHNGNRMDVSIVGQESNSDTWRLCKMNLAIRGITHDLGEENASTFTKDLHSDLKADYIMANPPFNLKNWRGENELTHDKRFAGWTLPSVSNANYAWIIHMLSKLNVTKGVAGFLLANGALNSGEDTENRKKLINDDRIEAIIVLPRDMFYTTDISVTMWILNMNKKESRANGRHLRDRRGEILFMDLRTWNQNRSELKLENKTTKKKVIFTEEQINRIKEIFSSWQSADTGLYKDIPELCRSVRKEEILNEENNGSLAPSNYIEFIDHDLEIDFPKEMARIQKEMKSLIKEEKETQKSLEDAFRGIGYEID